MTFQRIAVVGLGLMGGALAAACRKRFPRAKILGISRNRQALRYALRKKWIHESARHPGRELRNANLVVLCTPVDTFPALLTRIDRCVSRGTLVTDVGSVKEPVCRFVSRKKWKNIQFVGAHPMAGSHERGIRAVQPHLYESGFTFLIRDRKVSAKARTRVRQFWKKISSRVVEISASEHDRIVSDISHLPHALASALVLTAKPKALRHISSGFRDTTRIAQGDPSIWLPIFLENRKALLASFRRFERQWKGFYRALTAKQTRKLARTLSQAARRRRQI